MSKPDYYIGIDISTQTVSAILLGISPTATELDIQHKVSIRYSDECDRRTPTVWVEMVRCCIYKLIRLCSEAAGVRAIGISTAFPGNFPVGHDGTIDATAVSLYDNMDDSGVESFSSLLAASETDTLSRMWPGNMALGLLHLVKHKGLNLDCCEKLLPPNSAFAYALLRSANIDFDIHYLVSDFSQLGLSSLYDIHVTQKLPPGVLALLEACAPEVNWHSVSKMLLNPAPAWRNIVPRSALPAIAGYLGLPDLVAISIGAGDSSVGAMALMQDSDTIINVRGSSDSPVMIVPRLRNRIGAREDLLHYPLATAANTSDCLWAATAPLLRTGKVWDWVKKLRFDVEDICADEKLESLATLALVRSLSPPNKRLKFLPALGGERAPSWDASATGVISGIVEGHDIGDIAIAALEGISLSLAQCLKLMEDRYEICPPKLLLAGGPVRNKLWNYITQAYTGKQAYYTEFSDASVLGAAMLGYAASLDGIESDKKISECLISLSSRLSAHKLLKPKAVEIPDGLSGEMDRAYRVQSSPT